MSVATGVFWRAGDYAARKAADKARLKFASPYGDIVSLYRAYLAWVQQKNLKITRDTISGIGDDATDVADIMDLNDYEGRATEGVDLVVQEDDTTDSSDDSEDDDETKSQISSQPEDGQPMEVDSTTTDEPMQLEGSSNIDDAERDTEDKKAQSRSVWKWCKENYINNKALIAAESLAADLRAGLIKFQAWGLRANQEAQPDEESIQKMVLNASILNLAVRVREGAFQLVNN